MRILKMLAANIFWLTFMYNRMQLGTSTPALIICPAYLRQRWDYNQLKYF
jgi:hypothetical protein